MAISPQKALNEKFKIELSTAEAIEIVSNLQYVGSTLLETIDEVATGKVTMEDDKLNKIKTMECNCRTLMKKVINQIPEDIAKALNITKK